MKRITDSSAFILDMFRNKYKIEDKLIFEFLDFLSVEKNAKNICFIAINLEVIYSKYPDFKSIMKHKMILATEFLMCYPYTDILTIKNLVLREEKDFVFLM